MALFNVTVQRTQTIRGIRIEEGMNAEVVTKSHANPLFTPDGKRMIADAFERKYGVDLMAAGVVNSAWLDCEEE